MALNIKDPETEALAAEVARLASENKTQAIRTALRERRERLAAAAGGTGRARLLTALQRDVWPLVPDEARGKPLSKAEEEAILGIGPEGW